MSDDIRSAVYKGSSDEKLFGGPFLVLVGSGVMKKEKNKKPGLIESLKSDFYMLKLSYQAAPARVAGSFVVDFAQQLRSIFYGIVFWEFVLDFVENDAPFSYVIVFIFRYSGDFYICT